MTIRQVMAKVRLIALSETGPIAQHTAARILKESSLLDPRSGTRLSDRPHCEPGVFVLSADRQIGDSLAKEVGARLPCNSALLWISAEGSGFIVATEPHLLIAACRFLQESADLPAAALAQPKVLSPTIPNVRPLFDYFLTQTWRTARRFDPETYIRLYAETGYSHLEVNGLAGPYPFEPGHPLEVYPRFYSYCPALDQFVDSRLNRGIYPRDYLRNNLAFLRRNADLAQKYGLKPGLLVFEPRSVPETLFERYPMLRGARVDHPFRSLRPRYNLALSHPAVRQHYRELMQNLMREVPSLSYIQVWSNDSGAGFEHTHSLYVGRNGGAYLIREWKTHEEIARTAARNIVDFLRLLRDAAREINPEFRVVLRPESFDNEREYLWPELCDGLDVEGGSILEAKKRLQYRHPLVPECNEVLMTVHHVRLFPEEKREKEKLEARGCEAHFTVSLAQGFQFEPLVGVPCPWIVAEKLHSLRESRTRWMAIQGGTAPPSLAPWWINNEVLRAFQFEPELDVDTVVRRAAEKWVGPAHASGLVEAWRRVDHAVRWYPNPNFLYSTFGATWYRLFVRPLVPNFEAIPEEERAYYEAHSCNPPHNPQRVDLARDVLFVLTTQERCERSLEIFERECLPSLEKAIAILRSELAKAEPGGGAAQVLQDQLDRVRALRCWFRNVRNCAAWVAGVHGYLQSQDPAAKARYRELVRTLMLDEMDNTRELLRLWHESSTEWMAVSALGETMFLYDASFPRHLETKLRLMEAHLEDEPYIDPDYMWKKSAPAELMG
ncbi:MAG: hypothetical protein ONB23_13150 [candidate division KSB1 bacterium]|nr:hypothetical protein [candidate division KSB1 bacterium]